MTKTLLLHGRFDTLSSFSVVNRRLAKGLSALGYRVTVMPSDGEGTTGPPVSDPDIYLAHDYPYDLLNSPGLLNVFLLEYEYARILKRDRVLVERLNHFFDLVLAPSHFVRAVCERSGIRVPVVVCPLGVDPSEFHPGATPVSLATAKRFKYVYLGGLNERKGSDILLSAFDEEFSARDDVALILKTFGYDHLLAGFERTLAKIRRRRGAPEIVHLRRQSDSVAGYFTAADCGVFPFRGEGFGLPILECLACGRPVIVTEGTGPLDFCTAENALFVPAARVTRHGRQELEPDRLTLRRLLRAAYEGGLPHTAQDISASVAGWTWERTVTQIHGALQAHAVRTRVPQVDSPDRVGYAFYQKGVTSWKLVAQKVDHELARRFNYAPLGFHAPPPRGALRVVLGASGFALEHFVRAARVNPDVRRILMRGNGPFETTVAIDQRERRFCGVPPRRYEPMSFWRNRREAELADQIVVSSRASQVLFLKAGYPANKLHILPLGIVSQSKPAARRGRTMRFLFVGTTPFRKGIRILFEAWDALRPQHAELVCVASNEALQSPLLLRYLVRNPNIIFKPLIPRRHLGQEYVDCDCQVLPSFEDGFSLAVAEGMGFGKPAILSADVGLSDLIVHKENGYIVPSGSVTQLKNALSYFCINRRDIPSMGQAAYETARQYSWAQFQSKLTELVQSHMKDA